MPFEAFPTQRGAYCRTSDMKTRSISDIIESWIRNQTEGRFCEECVARAIGSPDPKTVSLAVLELTGRRSHDFSRYRARCTGCGNSTMVFSARRIVWG